MKDGFPECLLISLPMNRGRFIGSGIVGNRELTSLSGRGQRTGNQPGESADLAGSAILLEDHIGLGGLGFHVKGRRRFDGPAKRPFNGCARATARSQVPVIRGQRILADGLGKRGWDAKHLGQLRKADPEKLKIAARLRALTTVTFRWITQHLSMGIPALKVREHSALSWHFAHLCVC